MTPLAKTILKRAKEIIQDGGDTEACEDGAFCIGCCAAIAKGDLDDADPDFDNVAAMDNALAIAMGRPSLVQTDRDVALLEISALLKRAKAFKAHSKASALTTIDKLLESA